jgi:hypothetical protein
MRRAIGGGKGKTNKVEENGAEIFQAISPVNSIHLADFGDRGLKAEPTKIIRVRRARAWYVSHTLCMYYCYFSETPLFLTDRIVQLFLSCALSP